MWNNSVTSHDGGLEISLSGFQLARKSVVFRVFPAVFARLLVIKQRRGTCRFVHKMTNNGFEMIARFIFWCTCQFCLLFRQWIIFTYEYLSWKIFPRLKIILWTLSRYFSCFMWKVETGARFHWETIVCGKMTAFWVVEPRRWRLRLIFWTISSVFSRRCPSGISTLLQLPTEVGDRYGFLVIVVIDLLYVIPGVILLTCSEKNKLKASVER